MRGAVSMALAYNQVISVCYSISNTINKIQNDASLKLNVMQFTRSGHTQLLGNAIMITSTISVVLFSTMVKRKRAKKILKFFRPS